MMLQVAYILNLNANPQESRMQYGLHVYDEFAIHVVSCSIPEAVAVLIEANDAVVSNSIESTGLSL